MARPWPTGLGGAQPEGTTHSHHHVGPPPTGKGIGVEQAKVGMLADSWHYRLVLGRWKVTFLVRKELELKVEWCQLDIVGLTSTYSSGPGTKVQRRGWTLLFRPRWEAPGGWGDTAGWVLLWCSSPQRMRGLPLCNCESLRGMLSFFCFLSLLVHWTAAQSTQPSWSLLVAERISLGTMVTRAMMEKPGVGVIGRN